MLQGMKEYEQIAENLSREINNFESEIYQMEVQLEGLQELDEDLRAV